MNQTLKTILATVVIMLVLLTLGYSVSGLLEKDPKQIKINEIQSKIENAKAQIVKLEETQFEVSMDIVKDDIDINKRQREIDADRVKRQIKVGILSEIQDDINEISEKNNQNVFDLSRIK